jgi:hypothetical protein
VFGYGVVFTTLYVLSMQQQQQQDTALSIEHDTLSAHHRAAGQAYFDSVLAKAQQGTDPFAAEPPKKGSSTAAVAEDLHADVAAFGAALERHKGLLLATALVVSQAFSWVLMKVGGLYNTWHYNCCKPPWQQFGTAAAAVVCSRRRSRASFSSSFSLQHKHWRLSVQVPSAPAIAHCNNNSQQNQQWRGKYGLSTCSRNRLYHS